MKYVTVNFNVTGYQAEVLRLMAERSGKTVDQLVASFFASGYIAPKSGNVARVVRGRE